MKSMTLEETRRFFIEPPRGLAVDEDYGLPYWDSPDEYSFFIKKPLEHWRIVKLTYDLLTVSPISCFYGGLVWPYGWRFGTAWVNQAGWRIIEDMRRAHGDLRSLDLAPAQYFREDEFVDLHAYLIQVVAYGWPACYLPSNSGFFVSFGGSQGAVFHFHKPELRDELYLKLAYWEPEKKDAQATHALAITHYEAAQKRMSEGDPQGAIELFRASLIADTDFYEAAHGLAGALQETGRIDEAIEIAERLVEVTPDDESATAKLLLLKERKAEMENI